MQFPEQKIVLYLVKNGNLRYFIYWKSLGIFTQCSFLLSVLLFNTHTMHVSKTEF